MLRTSFVAFFRSHVSVALLFVSIFVRQLLHFRVLSTATRYVVLLISLHFKQREYLRDGVDWAFIHGRRSYEISS